MLVGARLPKTWGKAVNTDVYLITGVHHFSLNCKTLMDIWSGKLADYENLREVGTLAFAHVMKVNWMHRMCERVQAMEVGAWRG